MPGNVSGLIPKVPPGCNYYIRIISTKPSTNGLRWGPLCIGECDITTNNKKDLQFCVTDCFSAPQGQDQLISIDTHTFDSIAVYSPPNKFTTQLLSTKNFAQVGPNGVLGSVIALNDTMMNIHVPCKDSLAKIGVPAGAYYLRIVASNSSTRDNSLGTLIRLSIGAPKAKAPKITAYDYNTQLPVDTVCPGTVLLYYFNPYSFADNSTYLWSCNQINGGVPFFSPQGENSNSLLINTGAPAIISMSVQENNYGCKGPSATADTVVVLGPPAASITSPSAICKGDTIHFEVPFENNTYYNWTTGGGSVIDTANNELNVLYSNTGNYSVSILAINHCGTSNSHLNVTVNSYPAVSAGNDTSICEKNSISLKTNTGINYAYSWSSGNVFLGSGNSISISPDSSAVYTVKVTAPGGCVKNDSVKVTVVKQDIQFKNDSLCEGETLKIGNPEPASSYLWSNGSKSALISVSDTGLFKVTIVNPVELCPKIINFRVKESSSCFKDLKLPNVVTLNNDGLNDNFTPIITAEYSTFKIKIYNRWGEMVFESDDPHFSWDGRIKSGSLAPAGVYYYIAKASYKTKTMDDAKGFFSLIR